MGSAAPATVYCSACCNPHSSGIACPTCERREREAIETEPSSKITVTVWPNLLDTRGEAKELTRTELLELFRSPEPFKGKDEHPGCSLAVFDPPIRRNENVRYVTGAGLDFDQGDVSVERARQLWGEYAGLIHTTKSHHPDKPRFRVLLLFSRPVTPAEYAPLWRALANHAGGAVDQAPKDPARFWFLPSTPTGAPYEVHELAGEPLDVDAWIARGRELSEAEPAPTFLAPPPPPQPQPTPDRLARARAWLRKRDPAISGNGGHNQTFGTARALWGFGLDESEVWSLLLEYNATCQPPWSERELRHKLDSSRHAAAEPMPERERPQSTTHREAASQSTLVQPASQLSPLGECIESAFVLARRRCSGEEKPIPIPWSDAAFAIGGGIWPGMHSVVAGTGFGKSQLEFQKAAHAADNGVPVVLVALELDRESILLRMAAAGLGIRWSSLLTGRATLEQVARVEQAAQRFRPLPIYVEQGAPGQWTADHLESLARTVRKRHPDGPLLMVVDYLQLCGGPQRELRERVGHVAYRGRDMARELGIAVELVSSVARDKYGLVASAVETAGLGFEQRKSMAGTRRVVRNPDALIGLGKESGEIEFASDTATVLVKWPTPLETGERVMLAVVPKVRYGAPSWSALTFDGGRFVEYPVRSSDDLPEVESRSGRRRVDPDEYRERVLETVRRCNGLNSARAVERETKGNKDRVREALGALLEEGSVELKEGAYVVAQ